MSRGDCVKAAHYTLVRGFEWIRPEAATPYTSGQRGFWMAYHNYLAMVTVAWTYRGSDSTWFYE